MTVFQNKTPEELQKIIADAQLQLAALQRSKHKEVVAQIKELAESIGVTVEIHDVKKTSKKAVTAVQPKYRNPNNHFETWTGRGLTPAWLKKFIATGHSKSEFLIKG